MYLCQSKLQILYCEIRRNVIVFSYSLIGVRCQVNTSLNGEVFSVV